MENFRFVKTQKDLEQAIEDGFSMLLSIENDPRGSLAACGETISLAYQEITKKRCDEDHILAFPINEDFGAKKIETLDECDVKYVTLLNTNQGDNIILDEFEDLEKSFEAFEKLDVNNLENEQEYELAKYNKSDECLDWNEKELKSINKPDKCWVTKSL